MPQIGVMLPPGHPLGDRSEIRLEQLRNQHWILLPRKANPVFYHELISCCHKAGFAPDVVTEMTQPPVSEVACGIGIAPLFPSMTHLCMGGTTFHRLTRPTPTVESYIVYRKNPISPLLKAFISICLQLGKEP